MKIYEFTIRSKRGLHAQPAAALAAAASQSSCSVIMEHSGCEINVADPIKLMSSCIGCGERIIIKVSGDDEDNTLNEIKKIIELQL